MPNPDLRRRTGRPFAALIAAPAIMAGIAALAAPAHAQLAPHLGAPVQLGDLRQAFERAYGPVAAPIGGPNWNATAGIDVDVTYADDRRGLNSVTTSNRRGAEVLTNITPSLTITGNSQRLQGTFAYAPTLRFFAMDPKQNTVAQNLNASGRATIFEDLFFINASAGIQEYSRFGGLGQNTQSSLSRQDTVRSTSVSIGPQLRYVFRDYGAADITHNVGYINQSGQFARTNTPFAPALSTGNLITNTTNASFTSGDYFGRINFTGSINRTLYNGSGVLKGAHRNSETLDLGYAVTRDFTLLGLVGHQDVRYGGLRPIRIGGAIWNIGFRWNPDPDTSFTVRYGYRDGGQNVSFDASTAPTARTRISASYTEAIATIADDLQYIAQRGVAISPTIVIDPATGMPIQTFNNFAGAQGGASRTRRISFSGVLTQEIDVYTLSVNRDERTTLSADTAGAPSGITWLTASLGWQRELGPGLRGNTTVSYSDRSTPGFGNQQLMSFSAGLNWSLSETLSTRATYTYSRASSNRAGLSYDANLISVGMRKTF